MSLTPTVLTDGVIIIGSNTISDHGNKIELPITVDVVETTTFGQTYKTKAAGLKEAMLNISLVNDFATSNLDSIMFPLLGTTQTFSIRATSAATSTSNPAYTGSVIIAGWTPLSGSIGQLVQIDMSFPTTGTISRVTA